MKKVYRMKNLDCANCAAKMERAIAKLDGVSAAEMSFMAQRLTVELDENRLGEIEAKIQTCVAKVDPDCTVLGI